MFLWDVLGFISGCYCTFQIFRIKRRQQLITTDLDGLDGLALAAVRGRDDCLVVVDGPAAADVTAELEQHLLQRVVLSMFLIIYRGSLIFFG